VCFVDCDDDGHVTLWPADVDYHDPRPLIAAVCDARGCECLADVRSGGVALCSSHAWRLSTDDPLYRVLA
jgi:hypothetical protein